MQQGRQTHACDKRAAWPGHLALVLFKNFCSLPKHQAALKQGSTRQQRIQPEGGGAQKRSHERKGYIRTARREQWGREKAKSLKTRSHTHKHTCKHTHKHTRTRTFRDVGAPSRASPSELKYESMDVVEDSGETTKKRRRHERRFCPCKQPQQSKFPR